MTNYVNSVQQGTITIASGSTTGTASVTAPTGTGILLYQGNSTSATTSMAQSLVRLSISGTTVTATRNTSSTNTCTVNFAYIDADPTNLVNSVQYGSIAITSGTSNTATISSVTTGNSVVALLGFTAANATFDWELNSPILTLTSATVVTAAVGALSTNCTANFVVIEFKGSALNQSTQFFSKAWTNSTLTTTQTITSVNVNNSMLIYSGSHNGNTATSAIDQQYVTLTNATTVTIASGVANSDAIKCNFWVVEFVAGVLSQNAQRGTIALSAVTSNTATITSATTTQTLCNYCGFTTSISAVTSLATVLPNITQTNATTLTAAKNTGTGLTTVSYEALTFTAGGGGGFVAKERRTLPANGTKVGSRQIQGARIERALARAGKYPSRYVPVVVFQRHQWQH
jgi:hypothetical protein